MKRCPNCRRDYYDDSLSFCLDDGATLLDGPAAFEPEETAVLHIHDLPTEASIPLVQLTDAGAFRPTLPVAGPTDSWTIKKSWVPVALAVVILAAGGFVAYKYFNDGRKIESVAVMPFANESGVADLEYLSDGMTEALIGTLSQIPSLNVRARSSVFRYKGKETSPRQIGSDLNVQAVLNGSVIQRGADLILNVELVDTRNESVLWSKNYTRKQTDIAVLQNEVAREVSHELKAKLSDPDRQRLEKNHTQNAEAYTLYLQGRYFWNKRTPRDVQRAIDYFSQAIEKDPGYAYAYSGLADAYVVLPAYTPGASHDAYPKAKAAAEKALSLDDTLAEAHATLGVVLHEYDWKFIESEREFNRAIELKPSYATAHHWYGELLLDLGRYDEAVAEIKLAQSLEPLSLIINTAVGTFLTAKGDFEPAIEQLQKTLEIDSNFARAHLRLAFAYEYVEKFDEAADEYEKHSIASGRSASDASKESLELKEAYQRSGREVYWRKLLEIGERRYSLKTPDAPIPVAQAARYAKIGDADKAMEILEEAFRQRGPGILRMNSPSFDKVRSDRRFQDLKRRIGLP